MPIVIECCGRRYKLDDRAGLRRVKCIVCGKVVSLDTADSPRKQAEAPVELVTSDSAQAASHDEPPPLHVDDLASLASPSSDNNGAALTSETLGLSPPPSRIPLPPVEKRQKPGSKAQVASHSHFAPYWVALNRPAGSRPTTSSNGDLAAPFLIILYLGLYIFATFQELDSVKHLVGINHQRIPLWVPWLQSAVEVLLFFFVLAPLVLLALFLVAKFLEFELPPKPYLRACGVAAIPPIALVCFRYYPPNAGLPVAIALLVGFVEFYRIYKSFNLNASATALSLGAAALLYLGGQYVIKGISVGLLVNYLLVIDTVHDVEDLFQPGVRFQLIQSDAGSAAWADPYTTRSGQLIEKIRALSEMDLRGHWREDLMPRLEQVKAEKSAIEKLRGKTPELEEIASGIDYLERTYHKVPAHHPDPAIFAPLPTGPVWKPLNGDEALLATPVRLGHYLLSPPNGESATQIDQTKTGENGFVWGTPDSGELRFYTVSRKDPKQVQPWLATDDVARWVEEANQYLRIDWQKPNCSFGILAGLPATRIEATFSRSNGDDFVEERAIRYIAADGPSWIVVSIRFPASHPELGNALEAAARSLHKASP